MEICGLKKLHRIRQGMKKYRPHLARSVFGGTMEHRLSSMS